MLRIPRRPLTANRRPAMRLEIHDSRQTNENLVSSLREKSRKLTQTQELYEKLKRKAMLEEIEHTASQVVGSNVEATVGAGTTLADQHLAQGPVYSRGVVSPRYSHNTQLSPRYNLNAQQSPQFNMATFGGMHQAYTTTARSQPPRKWFQTL